MIQKIGKRFDIISNKSSNRESKQTVKQNQSTNPIEKSSINSALLQKYYISFGSKNDVQTEERLEILKSNYNQGARDLVDSATSIAKKNKHAEINENHIQMAAMTSLRDYVNDIDSGVKELNLEGNYALPGYFSEKTTPQIFKDKKLRKKVAPFLNEEIDKLDKILSETPKSATKAQPKLSKNIVSGLYDLFSDICMRNSRDFVPVDDAHFMEVIEDFDGPKSGNFKKFIWRFSEKFMVDGRPPEEKVHLKIYDDKAKNILKNLSLGTNMFVLHDLNANPMYLVDSVEDVLNNQGAEIGKINKNNTKITMMNNNVKEAFFNHKINELANDKVNNHIVVVDMDSLFINSIHLVPGPEGPTAKMNVSPEFFNKIIEQPKNIKFIVIEGKSSYYSNMADPYFAKAFENFGDIPFHTLNTEQAKTAFREQPLLMSKIEGQFSKKAIDKAVESAAPLEGSYPEKAQRLMKKLSSYYVDKKDISDKDVDKYVSEAKDLFKITNEGSSVEVIFDTGKKLDDFLGKNATKKEAEAIIKQIKKGALGTKGKLIYPQDGSVGAGRKFFAKAIATETKSPYVQLNARDFSTQEVDIFGGEILSPENAVKKVFSLVKTQAEASPHKSAVVFIEDFERLVFGDGFSQGYAKAMSQLSREMDTANKKGLNILVLGSTRYGEWADACAANELKFIDRVEVETPSRNIEAREEILSNLIKKKKLKIAGANEVEKKELVKLMAETSNYFPFVDLRNFVDKVKTVAFEKGHKQIAKDDITEGYLQLTTGRPASGPISQHRKEIVTSHEWGHATNLEVMWNIAKKQNTPWHLPDRVNFITLDPRGDFGGAMYHKNSANEEHLFETSFAEGVCSYGGHSAQKKFFNIDGSYGIASDFESATRSANLAAGFMGQGHYTGKISLGGMILPPSSEIAKNIEKDTEVMTKNQLLVSDLITEHYAGFNIDSTKKYSHLVGTGDCLVQGDTFRQEMKDWIAKQTKSKKAELDALDKKIVEIMEATKKGKLYTISKPAEAFKKVLKTALRFR